MCINLHHRTQNFSTLVLEVNEIENKLIVFQKKSNLENWFSSALRYYEINLNNSLNEKNTGQIKWLYIIHKIFLSKMRPSPPPQKKIKAPNIYLPNEEFPEYIVSHKHLDFEINISQYLQKKEELAGILELFFNIQNVVKFVGLLLTFCQENLPWSEFVIVVICQSHSWVHSRHTIFRHDVTPH